MTRPIELAAPLAVAWALALGCQPGEPTTSSETHFLRYCPESEACSAELECLCAVCDTGCRDDTDCAELSPLAVCVSTDARPADQACSAEPDATCEVPCAADTDCRALGTDYRCDRSYCRALASDCVAGETTGDDVALFGDNFVPPALTAELERLAHAAGALATDQSYRDYASSLVGPFGGSYDLFTQYDAAVSDGVPEVAILDMGGPDALQSCPDPPTDDCPALANAASGAEQLLAQMAADGVQSAVVFFYPDPNDAVLGAKFDLLRPMIQAACAGSALACTFLDLRPTFDGHADYLGSGGVLPTDAGAIATATAIFSLMQEHCIGQ